MEQPPFWLVWQESGGPPRVKHKSMEDAEAEATRLSGLSPNVAFFVLAPVCKVERTSVVITRYDIDSIPF